MRHQSRLWAASGVTGLLMLVSGCGGGGSSLTSNNSAGSAAACIPGNDVVGAWKSLSNNQTTVPDSGGLTFFSYNQPSVNVNGLVVFRGRAKTATDSGEDGGGGGGGSGSGSTGMGRGVFTVNACLRPAPLSTVADTQTAVPAPNNTGSMFTEFPSIPRIDMDSDVVATRGQSKPVWQLSDGTKLGTSGVYVTLNSGLNTAVGLLGSQSDFSYMEVPDASTTGVKFDQFPGSPTVTQGRYVLFKGNYTDGSTSKTGVYFRDLGTASSRVQVIADSNMIIPGTVSTLFGSTAPPSAAKGQVVFVGLDNEDAPMAGGIYIAPVASKPPLSALVTIGETVVPDATGSPLAGSPTFSQLGEGLAFDGRYIAFWGAWGTHDPNGMREVVLNCPTDGSTALRDACNQQYPSGQAQMQDPVNQGIFLYDTVQHKLWMVAKAGEGEQFQDFLFWVFSGSPGASGGSDSSGPTDAEPPRWRASSFAAVDGARGVLFKAARQPGDGTVPASGVYGAAFTSGTIGPVFKVVEVGDAMAPIDPAAPPDSSVTSVGLERESLRGGWLAMTVSSLDPASESWAGIYATYFPAAFHVNVAAAPGQLGTLVLGR